MTEVLNWDEREINRIRRDRIRDRERQSGETPLIDVCTCGSIPKRPSGEVWHYRQCPLFPGIGQAK